METRRLPPQLRVLLEGQYGLYFLGNGLSLVGTWMQRIACSWLIWDWTGSAFWVGVLAACDLLPVILIGPVAGVAADRWDRLRQNRIAQALSAVVAVALAVLYGAGMLGILSMIALVTIQGTLMASVQAARMAMVNQMVPRADLGIAVALGSVAFNLARLLGPAIAGLMIVQFDIIWIFFVNAAFTLSFVVILGRLRLTPRGTPLPSGRFVEQFLMGFRHLFGSLPLRLIIGAQLLGCLLLRALLEIAPAVAAEAFTNSAAGLAALTTSAGGGALIAALLVGHSRTGRIPRAVLIWWAVGSVAAFILIHAGSIWVAVPATVVLGGASTRAMVGTQTFVQMTTPDELRGRVLGVYGLIARGSPALGALALGFFADRIGLSMTITAGAVLLFVAMLTLVPAARRAGAEGEG